MCQIGEPGWPDGRWVMPTYADTDLRTMIDRVQTPVLADELNEAIAALNDADSRIQSASYRLGLLVRESAPLPAPAPTEDAIVAALKADPEMAGRVMATLAFKWQPIRLPEVSDAAKAWSLETGGDASVRRAAIQSLAVALAAASYRG